MGLSLTQAATLELLDYERCREHLRLTHDDDQEYITSLVALVTQVAEHITGRALLTQEWRFTLARFPSHRTIFIPKPPLQSVDAVKYYDQDNTLQTLSSDNYLQIKDRSPGMIELKPSASWPTVYDRSDAVQIEFTAGWASVAEVPAGIKQAALLLLTHYFSNRSDVVTAIGAGVSAEQLPKSVDMLLRHHAVFYAGQ